MKHCGICNVTMRDSEKVRWCPNEDCPNTEQREPTYAEAKALRRAARPLFDSEGRPIMGRFEEETIN